MMVEGLLSKGRTPSCTKIFRTFSFLLMIKKNLYYKGAPKTACCSVFVTQRQPVNLPILEG